MSGAAPVGRALRKSRSVGFRYTPNKHAHTCRPCQLHRQQARTCRHYRLRRQLSTPLGAGRRLLPECPITWFPAPTRGTETRPRVVRVIWACWTDTAYDPCHYYDQETSPSSSEPCSKTVQRTKFRTPLDRHPPPWNIKLLTILCDVPRQWFRPRLLGTSGIHAGFPPSGLSTVPVPHGLIPRARSSS